MKTYVLTESIIRDCDELRTIRVFQNLETAEKTFVWLRSVARKSIVDWKETSGEDWHFAMWDEVEPFCANHYELTLESCTLIKE